LRDQGDINIAVDWDDLGANGIERDKPISFRARDVRLRTAMQEILRQAGGDVSLGFIVAEGLLRVATKSKLDRDKSVLVYDIRDLIVNIPRFTSAPRVDQSQLPDAPPIAGFAGSSNPIFGDFASENDDQVDQRIRKADKEMVHQVTDIIRTTVEPDSWRETGGGDGALRELNGQLIVYNTSSAQQQVQDLLSQLRQSRALMIAVEARFLIVTSNFLEEIGVDLDFVFNAGTAGFDPAFNNQQQALIDPFTGSRVLIPRQVSRAGVIPAVPGFGGGALGSVTPASPFLNPGLIPAAGSAIPRSGFSTPLPVAQNSIGLANPGNINTGIPGTLSQSVAEARNAGINFAGSYLDNLQVDFLIRATQASRRSSVVQAPRLMLFNGQRAWVAVVRSRQYVSTVTANVAEGAVGVQPVIAVAQSGTSLDVQGTISADRKYVTITVRTGIAQEPNFEDFQVQRASGNSPGIFVRLVDQETRGLRTTVSVPDGGTVLLGGLKQVGEVELEAGVPILSKIPVLKRAFTNTTTVKDTQTLLILLKTKILIQSEAEEEAFPRLGSAG